LFIFIINHLSHKDACEFLKDSRKIDVHIVEIAA